MKIEKSVGCNLSAKVETTPDKTTFSFCEDADRAECYVAFSMEVEPRDSYVFIPACAYDGNRFDSVSRAYPPFYLENEFGVNRPTLITDLPRLSKDGNSLMEVTTGDMATPCVGVYNKLTHTAFFVFFSQQCRGLNLGVTISERGGVLCIKLMAPSKRSKWYCWLNDTPGMYSPFPMIDPPMSVRNGNLLTVSHQVVTRDCADVEEFFRIFFDERCGRIVEPEVSELPFSEVFKIIEENKNRLNFDEAEQFYTVAITEPPVCYGRTGRWTPGWTGGGTMTMPLLYYGSELSKQRALSTLEFVTTVQSDFGYFYGVKAYDGIHHDCYGMYEEKYSAVFIRKHSDLAYFLFKQLEEMKKLGITIPQKLENCAKKAVDALVNTFERYGEIGQFVNGETGEILVGGTTAGGVALGALALASRWFGDIKYLRTAEMLGELYYERYIKNGIINGGQAESMAAPDSEGAVGTLEGYITMFECTGAELWKRVAIAVGHQLASWVVSYDYVFPATSELARIGVKASGSVFANIQNKHAAPGFGTYSASGYFKLYRATQDERYLMEMRRITRFIPQVMSKTGEDIIGWGNDPLRKGFICERVNLSDWETPDRIGEVYNSSNWPEICPLLSMTETPGIYVDKTKGKAYAIDYMDVSLADGVLTITNKHACDAFVTVLAEDDVERAQPLGGFWADKYTEVTVPKGGTVTVAI